MSQPSISATISTPRLLLRPYRFTDVTAMHRYLQQPGQSEYLEGADTDLNESQVEAIIARHILADTELRTVWAITKDDVPIGAISINFEKQGRVGEIGYHISKRLWGYGYASEAAAAVVNAAFQSLPRLQRIQASIHPDNQASIRVAEYIGMQFEGTLRNYAYIADKPADESIYAVLRSPAISS